MREDKLPPTQFVVSIGDTTRVFDDRAAAVAEAKAQSREHDRRVTLEATDGSVSMQFTRGDLESFTTLSRPGG